jgi:hypothetical protein
VSAVREALDKALQALQMSSLQDALGGERNPVWQELRAEAIDRVEQELRRLDAEELDSRRENGPEPGHY